jgi:hypothetical protein
VFAGAAEWPVGDAAETAVRAAFARGLPSDVARSRIAAKPVGGGRMKIEKRQQDFVRQRKEARKEYGDAKVANREIRGWHGATENGP